MAISEEKMPESSDMYFGLSLADTHGAGNGLAPIPWPYTEQASTGKEKAPDGSALFRHQQAVLAGQISQKCKHRRDSHAGDAGFVEIVEF
ncbi:MAG: hypothetical protein P8X77_09920 [Maritimibacter sp.]|jgi:hypothetical protein